MIIYQMNIQKAVNCVNEIYDYNIMKQILDNIFTGKDKYTVGIMFMFANLAGYFLNMRKLKINDTTSIIILCIMVYFSRLIV